MRIIRYPHPTLRHKSKPLRRVDADLKKMVAEMLDLMYEDNGVGLAANQVDLPYRLFVMNPTGDPNEPDQQFVFINPVISNRSGSAEADEGCLSLPEIFAPVRRADKIQLSGYNLNGEEMSFDLKGFLARVAQHEYDHLDGVLFVDRLSETNQLAVRQQLAELEAEYEGNRMRGFVPGDEQITARLAELEAART